SRKLPHRCRWFQQCTAWSSLIQKHLHRSDRRRPQCLRNRHPEPSCLEEEAAPGPPCPQLLNLARSPARSRLLRPGQEYESEKLCDRLSWPTSGLPWSLLLLPIITSSNQRYRRACCMPNLQSLPC